MKDLIDLNMPLPQPALLEYTNSGLESLAATRLLAPRVDSKRGGGID